MIKLKMRRCYVMPASVNGRWLKAADGKTIAVENPANSMIIGHVPSLSADEVEAAVESAGKAFSEWSRRAAKDRAAILRRWFDLMVANADDLGALMTAEQGKPFAEARAKPFMRHLSWNGSRRKPNVFMAIPFLRRPRTSALPS